MDAPLKATNAQLETRVKALETWRTTATAKIAALEARPATDVSALTARIATLEAKLCPRDAEFDAIRARRACWRAEMANPTACPWIVPPPGPPVRSTP